VVLGVLGCGGGFAESVKRGDQYAQAGMWDKAAIEYQAAQRLEPGNPDVEIKLRQIARRRSGERLTRARALLARGEIEAGLAASLEAAKLDPESAEAQRALDDANQAALRRAEELLTGPEAARALELVQLVLAGSPNDPRARQLDDRVRDALAGQSYDQAEAFVEAGKLGNALLGYAAAQTYHPGFRDTGVRIGDVKLSLVHELTFYVVLDRLVAPGGGEQALAGQLKPELIAQAFDDKLPLRVVADAPAPPPHGVHLTAELSGYRFGPARTASRNAGCDYVRGYDTVPNPQRELAEHSVSGAEQQLADFERQVDQDQHELDRVQRDVDDVQKDLMRAEADADRARTDYERCMANAASAASAAGSSSSSSSSASSQCSSPHSSYESAQNQVQNQRSRVQSAQSSLASVRDRMRSTTERRASLRHDVEYAQERMRREPLMIQQPHYERENYPVETRSIDAAVTLTLHAESLRGRVSLLGGEAFPQVIEPIRDEGWLARPATCPPRGKQIQLPDERSLRGELAKRTIATLREKVQSMYDSYRTKFLADARRQEAGGVPEEAVESYVRYLLTGRTLDPYDDKQIRQLFQRTRGFGKIELLGGL
jgi:tetratricopeptide (TPR) repeat protein